MKTFVSPKWTLEYAIASTRNFRWLLLKAILCAQREANSNKYGVTDEKLTEIEEEITQFQQEVVDNSESDSGIAFQIYYATMLATKTSKAITAQWLAHFLLAEKDKYKPLLESDDCLKYIVDAIKYAAGV